MTFPLFPLGICHICEKEITEQDDLDYNWVISSLGLVHKGCRSDKRYKPGVIRVRRI